jgi:hypothetical protein
MDTQATIDKMTGDEDVKYLLREQVAVAHTGESAPRVWHVSCQVTADSAHNQGYGDASDRIPIIVVLIVFPGLYVFVIEGVLRNEETTKQRERK